jgi:hypothetical protein
MPALRHRARGVSQLALGLNTGRTDQMRELTARYASVRERSAEARAASGSIEAAAVTPMNPIRATAMS